jgi:hypothetical protein
VLFDAFADDGVDQPPLVVVAIDQDLARHRAVCERHDARIAVEPGVGHEARHEPRMQRAEIAQRVPDVAGVRVDDNVFLDGGHGYEPLQGWVSSFRDGPKDQTSDAQLRIGESRDSQVRNCAP